MSNFFKYLVGEKLVCKLGYTSDSHCSNYGGSAYGEGRLHKFITVKEMSCDVTFGNCYFFNEIDDGIYEFALDGIAKVRDNKINEILKHAK